MLKYNRDGGKTIFLLMSGFNRQEQVWTHLACYGQNCSSLQSHEPSCKYYSKHISPACHRDVFWTKNTQNHTKHILGRLQIIKTHVTCCIGGTHVKMNMDAHIFLQAWQFLPTTPSLATRSLVQVAWNVTHSGPLERVFSQFSPFSTVHSREVTTARLSTNTCPSDRSNNYSQKIQGKHFFFCQPTPQ